MACEGLIRRQVETEEKYFRNAFLLRGCWDLISGNGTEVRRAASVSLFAPN